MVETVRLYFVTSTAEFFYAACVCMCTILKIKHFLGLFLIYFCFFKCYSICMRTRNTKTLPHEKENDAIREICTLLAGISDVDLISDFFGCLFTSGELKDFANRWHLVKELEAGATQREISKKYSMSLCNITRGSRELKKENSAFIRVLDILKEKTNQESVQQPE